MPPSAIFATGTYDERAISDDSEALTFCIVVSLLLYDVTEPTGHKLLEMIAERDVMRLGARLVPVRRFL